MWTKRDDGGSWKLDKNYHQQRTVLVTSPSTVAAFASPSFLPVPVRGGRRSSLLPGRDSTQPYSIARVDGLGLAPA